MKSTIDYPSSEVVICTKDRPDVLARCLDSILDQDVVPVITVVDGGEDEPATAVCEARSGPRARIKYLRSAPGLTRQRNVGVRHLESDTEIVHFLDDDVELLPGYFSALLEIFERDAGHEVGGVGGVIRNEPPRRTRLINRIFLTTSTRDGALLRSGRNIHVYRATQPLQVDWLGGGLSSYRREVLESEPFDETFEGYSFGEDVEFSYRVSRRWKLMVTPQARLDHTLSELNRPSRYSLIKREIEFRHRFVKRHHNRMGIAAFWWSVVGEVLVASIGAALMRDPDKWLRARAVAAGARTVLTRRGLVA